LSLFFYVYLLTVERDTNNLRIDNQTNRSKHSTKKQGLWLKVCFHPSGFNYPTDRKAMDGSIQVLEEAIRNAKLGDKGETDIPAETQRIRTAYYANLKRELPKNSVLFAMLSFAG